MPHIDYCTVWTHAADHSVNKNQILENLGAILILDCRVRYEHLIHVNDYTKLKGLVFFSNKKNPQCPQIYI